MMTTVKQVFDILEQKAPFQYQLGFDNAGFLVGHGNTFVERILISLDITSAVVEEAISVGAQLIVSHHPVIWDGIKQLTDQTPGSALLLKMVENGISAICAHTNLDAVKGGVNDALAHQLGLKEIQPLKTDGADVHGNPYGIGRIGQVRQQEIEAFAAFVKDQLCAGCVRFVNGGQPVEYVAVGGGSCGNMLEDVVSVGCDTFVTSDVKYDVFLQAKALGLNLLDAGHFPTENVITPILEAWLHSAFPSLDVQVSQSHKEIYQCI